MENFMGYLSLIISIFDTIGIYLTWKEAKKAQEYVEKREKPDLWLVRDKFVYGDYKIAEDEANSCNQPKDIPPKSIVLRNVSVIENSTNEKYNHKCIIVNSSSMNSSTNKIGNFTGFFGEVTFENRGTVGIKKIKINNLVLKMSKDYEYALEDIELKGIGEFEVDIHRGEGLSMLLCYLYDEGVNMLCDPKCIKNGILDENIIKEKRQHDNQLGCHLPVIIDLYDEAHLTLEYSAQDEKKYTQQQSIIIKRDKDGGWYEKNIGVAETKNL